MLEVIHISFRGGAAVAFMVFFLLSDKDDARAPGYAVISVYFIWAACFDLPV